MAATTEKPSEESTSPCFSIALPGGRVARIPQDVVEKYIVSGAHAAHAPAPSAATSQVGATPNNQTTIRAGESMITINIYAGQGEIAIQQHEANEDDVVAHSLSVDATTGTSEFHTDWEFGECEYTDETGFPQRIQAWHRHPFGTEYGEIYDG